jgi:hypothetical protein
LNNRTLPTRFRQGAVMSGYRRRFAWAQVAERAVQLPPPTAYPGTGTDLCCVAMVLVMVVLTWGDGGAVVTIGRTGRGQAPRARRR